MTHDDPTARKLVLAVAGREVVTRLRTKAFAISTIAILVLAGGYLALTVFANGHKAVDTIGFTPQTAAMAAGERSAAAALGGQVLTKEVESQARAESQVRSGQLTAAVVGPTDAPVVLVKTSLDGALRNSLDAVVRQVVLEEQLSAVHADTGAVEHALTRAGIQVKPLLSTNQDARPRLGIGIVAAVLLYISLTIYGQMVAQGVVEEKASRVVELLLPAVRAWQLMLGKVLGIAVVGLIQLMIFMVVGLSAAAGTGTLQLPTAVAMGTAAWALAWYLIGFLMYALLCAACAALVSRQEEVGNTVGPVMMLLFIPFASGIALLPGDPHNHILAAMSLIPLFAPILLPLRDALGVVPVWESVFATTTSVLTVAALIWLAGRVYGYAILRTGSRVRLGQALGIGAA